MTSSATSSEWVQPNDQDRLLESVARRDLEPTRRLLDQGIDPNGIGRLVLNGNQVYARRSPLAQACRDGDEALVNLLLERGARPVPLEGDEPLDPTSMALAQRLVAAGWFDDGQARVQAMGTAAGRGKIPLLRHHLVAADGRPWPLDPTGSSVLHRVVARGFSNEVQRTTDADGWQDVIRALLDQAVDVRTVNREGYTALHLVLARFIPGREPVDRSWLDVQAGTVRALLQAGADVNAMSPDGTPLVLALSRSQHATGTVQALLERGARVGYPDPAVPGRASPGSALVGAVSSGRMDLVELALAHGEPLDEAACLAGLPGTPYFQAVPPLVRAAVLGHRAILERLLDAGASVATLDRAAGWDPMVWRRDRMLAGTAAFLDGRDQADEPRLRAVQIETITLLEQRVLRDAIVAGVARTVDPEAPGEPGKASAGVPPGLRSRSRL